MTFIPLKAKAAQLVLKSVDNSKFTSKHQLLVQLQIYLSYKVMPSKFPKKEVGMSEKRIWPSLQ